MSNLFSLQRFMWLFNKHTKDHYKTYLMSLAILVGVLTLILTYVAIQGGLDGKTQNIIFGSLLVGIGFVFTSSIFSDIGNKQSSTSALTLPVAHLERFAVAWVYSFIVFQIIYIVFFFLINNIATTISHYTTEEYRSVNLLWGTGSIYFSVLLYYCFFHALAFLGAVSFKKSHFIKIAFTFLVFIVVLMIINKIVTGSIFDSKVSTAIPFNTIAVREDQGYYLTAREWFEPIFTTMVLISTVSLWAATYFKLKEKQV